MNDLSEKKMFSLEGKVVVLTGATGYFGKSFAHSLCNMGATIILVSRNNVNLRNLRSDLLELGHANVDVYSADLFNDDERKKLFKYVESSYEKVDVLINNAYSGNPGTIDSSSISDFSEAFDITVTAAFRLVQLFQPLLSRTEGSSSVINIASMYGVVSPDGEIYGNNGLNNPPYYGAAKAGLIQLTRYLACHMADKGIRVNSVSPGAFPPVDISSKNPKFYKELCRKTPMNRIGLPHELSGVLLLLASDSSSFITGANIPVDGGWTAW